MYQRLHSDNSRWKKSAFSLVELSIVLVILGLLVGGVLSGQSLIRAAELRSVPTEYSKYMAAARTFQDKYFALPGDMANATAFWGIGSGCTTSVGVAATPGTCNGNASGDLTETGTGNSTYSELNLFWQHLTNAGLIEGTFTGQTISSGWIGYVSSGINVPKAKLQNGTWAIADWANTTGDSHWLNMVYGVSGPSRLWLGTASNTSGGIPSVGYPLVKPEEIWNIDTKIDDGKPATGVLRVIGVSNCTTSATGADAAIASANYRLSNTAVACAFMFDNNGRGIFR